jgi:hypothetical protein
MQRTRIQPPIIIDETGDIDVFGSIEGTEMYLEPDDVEKERFVAYDSEGRLLRLIPTTPRITIECAEWTPSHAGDVRRLLVKFLEDIGIANDKLREKSLQELVAAALKHKTR